MSVRLTTNCAITAMMRRIDALRRTGQAGTISEVEVDTPFRSPRAKPAPYSALAADVDKSGEKAADVVDCGHQAGQAYLGHPETEYGKVGQTHSHGRQDPE